MNDKKTFIHPYIPNSVPEIQKEMLKSIGVKSIEELYEDIPERLRFSGEMNLPKALTSEYELKRHVEKILAKNKSVNENLSFLGGGVAQHYVPTICDEINHRAEFLTAYAGEPYEDHGRFQSLFEYESLMAELLDVDVVNVPTFDYVQAAATSIRMTGRITGRNEALIAGTISPDRLKGIKNYCEPVMKVTLVEFDKDSGLMNLDDLKSKLNDSVSAVFFENPSYLGFLETQGEQISEIAHANGSMMIVAADPISLGVITPPSNYGADITCGDIQSLGLHLYFGGATGGFIATADDPKLVNEYPSRLFGITKTSVEGEWGFGDVLYDDRTSFGNREGGKEYVGTASALWGITAAVYLSLMGPKGIEEIGQAIMQKSQYLMKKISDIRGVQSPKLNSVNFKEFLVDFNETGKTVEQINKELLDKNIFGGKDLSKEFPELGQSALYCVTEIHTQEDLDALAAALKEVLN